MSELYKVGIIKEPIESSEKVVQNLKQYSKDADELILWLDCDREGEAIAFDIIDVIQKTKPRVDIWRAKFSAVTREEVTKAMDTLVRPDKALADAVRVRQEVDLRIGASFTRFQTLLLRDALAGKQGVISYGPC